MPPITSGSERRDVYKRQGHAVSVVDDSPENLEMLDDSFSGLTVTGVPIDQDVLRTAGIEDCDAVACVTHDDNINIMASQVAKTVFQIPKVITRIYDPRCDDVFSEFGLTTICPTSLTADAVASMLLDSAEVKYMTIGNSIVSFTLVPVMKNQVGLLAEDIKLGGGETLFAVQDENGKVTLYQAGTHIVLKDGDRLVISGRAN